MFEVNDCVRTIWQYSEYYGDMVYTAQRLDGYHESYAAMCILFNVTELLFKSLRENFKQNFNKDIEALSKAGLLMPEEVAFFNDEYTGVREIRNIMTHRDAYQYCFESPDGKAMPFTEQETWNLLYRQYSPIIIGILHNAIIRSQVFITE